MVLATFSRMFVGFFGFFGFYNGFNDIFKKLCWYSWILCLDAATVFLSTRPFPPFSMLGPPPQYATPPTVRDPVSYANPFPARDRSALVQVQPHNFLLHQKFKPQTQFQQITSQVHSTNSLHELRPFGITPQLYFTNLVHKSTPRIHSQSYSTNSLHKFTSQVCSTNLLHKFTPQTHSSNLLHEVAPKTYSSNSLRKFTIQI